MDKETATLEAATILAVAIEEAGRAIAEALYTINRQIEEMNDTMAHPEQAHVSGMTEAATILASAIEAAKE